MKFPIDVIKLACPVTVTYLIKKKKKIYITRTDAL